MDTSSNGQLSKQMGDLEAAIRNLKSKIDIIKYWLHETFDGLPPKIQEILNSDDFDTNKILTKFLVIYEEFRCCNFSKEECRKFKDKSRNTNSISNEREETDDGRSAVKEDYFETDIKKEQLSDDGGDFDSLVEQATVCEYNFVNEQEISSGPILLPDNCIDSQKSSSNKFQHFDFSRKAVVVLSDIMKNTDNSATPYTLSTLTKAFIRNNFERECKRSSKRHSKKKEVASVETSVDPDSSVPLSKYSTPRRIVHKSRISGKIYRQKLSSRYLQNWIQKPFHCHYKSCQRGFLTQKSLRQHMKIAHPDYKIKIRRTPAKYMSNVSDLNTNIFSCAYNFCDKIYLSKNELLKHQQQDGHIVSECTMCSQYHTKFSTDDELKIHICKKAPYRKESYKCELCKEVYKTKPAFIIHLKSHGNAFKCDYINCKRIFVSQNGLRRHKIKKDHSTAAESISQSNSHVMVKSEEDRSTGLQINSFSADSVDTHFQCPKCQKGFSTLELLNRHVLSTCFKCLVCKETFRFENELHQHSQFCKKKKTPYVYKIKEPGSQTCELCQITYNIPSEFDNHMNQHSIQLYYCNHRGCKRKFINEEDVDEHEKKLHCGMCLKLFSHKAQFSLHNEKHHNKEALLSIVSEIPKMEDGKVERISKVGFQCDKCGRLFHSIQTRFNHLRIGCNQCEFCGTAFSSKESLESHVIGVHKRDRPFLCNTCGKTFPRKDNLRIHMNTQHATSRKTFECAQCNKTFVTKVGYTRHMKRHDGIQRVQCSICGFDFANPSSLKKHTQSIHENLRPYPCNLCENKFKSTASLKYHLKTHENPLSKKRGLNKRKDTQ